MKPIEDSANYVQVISQTREEKIAMYMKLPKKKICEMLAECNLFIESIPPRVIVQEKQQNS